MTLRHYILEGARVRSASLMEWAAFMGRDDRVIGSTKVGGFHVSTVFLGLDHNFSGTGPPVLWETMVFDDGGLADFEQKRCAGGRDQAEEMHLRTVREVEAMCGIPPVPEESLKWPSN